MGLRNLLQIQDILLSDKHLQVRLSYNLAKF